MELIKCTEKDIQRLYDGSAWTWEGMNTDDDNLKAISDWFKDKGCPLKKEEFWVTTGKQMNEFCGKLAGKQTLTGDNAYPEDLSILSIELDNITDVPKLYMAKFEVKARWFDDCVDNNVQREH